MNYEIEFGYYYQVFDNFKEKDASILTNSIAQSRIGQYIQLESYANISFDEDDKHKRYGHVTSLSSFDKKKTNCLVYNMPVSEKNEGKYDKLFLYSHQGKMDMYYGYVLHNSQTGYSTQIADTSGDINDIMLSLNRTIYSFPITSKFEKLLIEKRAQEKQFERRKHGK